ncbi:jg4794, partial [Pararge aegeria aegeria]
VLSYDPYVPVDAYGEDYGVRMELNEMWPLADYITLHMPLNDSTR